MHILEIIKNIPKERIGCVLRLLSPLEREIFEVLLRKETAASVYDIVKDLADRYFSILFFEIYHLESMGIIKTKLDKALQIKEIEKAGDFPLVELFSGTYFPGKTYVPLNKFVSAVNEYFPKIEDSKNETEEIKYKKELLKNFFPFPSFRRIERILNDFVMANLVIAREESKGKSKVLYAVNPEYLPSLLEFSDRSPKTTLAKKDIEKKAKAFVKKIVDEDAEGS